MIEPKKESVWSRLIKTVFKQPTLAQRPPAELDDNSRVLARLQDNDPVYRCLLDHAFSEYSNNLVIAIDPTRPPDLRLRYLDRAGGVYAFLEDIETRRLILREDWKKQLRLAKEERD